VVVGVVVGIVEVDKADDVAAAVVVVIGEVGDVVGMLLVEIVTSDVVGEVALEVIPLVEAVEVTIGVVVTVDVEGRDDVTI
jgi:hypothetical protein